MVSVLPAGCQNKLFKPEAAPFDPVSGKGDIVSPARRLRVGVQADDAGKIARVFLRQRGGSHRTAGGKGLFCQQAHVLLSHGHPGVVQQQLLFFAQLLLIQPGLPHRGQRRFAAGRGGRVEGLCPEHRRRVEVQVLCHRAVIRREQLVGRFDLLGVAAGEGGGTAPPPLPLPQFARKHPYR